MKNYLPRQSTSEELIDAIDTIQEEWWEGSLEMNVALSEIRGLIWSYKNEAKWMQD